MSQSCHTPLIWRAEWAGIKEYNAQKQSMNGNQEHSKQRAAKKVPCIYNLEGQSCPSERGSSQQWKSRCCVTTRCNKDTSCEDPLSLFLHEKCYTNKVWVWIDCQWREITSSALAPPRELTWNEASVGSLSWFCTFRSADTSGFHLYL